MSRIANLTSHPTVATNYSNIAHAYISQWESYAFANNAAHASLSYGDEASWGLLYNLFMDRELGLEVVPQRVYDKQDAWYEMQFGRWGVPLDTRHGYTKSECLFVFDGGVLVWVLTHDV
jgi:hypothetical protein